MCSSCAGGRGDLGVGGGGVVGAEDGGAGDEEGGAGVGDRAGGRGVDAAVDLDPGVADERRRRATLSGEPAMKDCPPQPGLTVMQRTMSASPRSSATASAGVPGLIATPGQAAELADRGQGAVGVRRRLARGR